MSEEAPQIGVADLESCVKIIDACAQRGAFRGDEMASVGQVRNRINSFVEANKPVEATEVDEDQMEQMRDLETAYFEARGSMDEKAFLQDELLSDYLVENGKCYT